MFHSNKLVQRCADNIRLLSVAMVEKAKSGHPGGPMGGADFIQLLFSEYLEFDPEDREWPERDRLFLDPGHMSAMLYSGLALTGAYSMDDLKAFRQWGSPTPGHPEVDKARGIENTSGPLGLGHAFGLGSAIAERFMAARFGEEIAHKTYIYISDGGIQEEISQGVGRIAGHLGLGNLIMFYDANDVQLSHTVGETTTEDTAAKYKAWGWRVRTIDGNDIDAIRYALRKAIIENDRPNLIIGRTIMGKGAVKESGESYEGEVELHGKPLGSSEASYSKTIENLGGDTENPFVIFPDVAKHYDKMMTRRSRATRKRKAAIQRWREKNPDLADKYDYFLSGKTPDLDWNQVALKANDATRNSSSAVLNFMAGKIENMIVASADLSNSDKTDGFLKKTKPFAKGDFSGAFLQAGVAELTMAAVAVGMGLHGGVIPVCATFFAFSDYMKPALRVAALMETRAIFLWTHDSFRVGEDGPTHQPVEQEAQLRLLEKLQNHKHRNSFLVLRPADGPETVQAWKMAIENTATPTGLIFSRQNVEDIPVENRAEQAKELQKGAYIVQDFGQKPAVVLIANGSELSTLMVVAQNLSDEYNIASRVVSVPSEGVFRKQPIAYQERVLPSAIPRFGLTAGLPVTLEGLVGSKGKVWGLKHFGYSAPAKVLDEKFGFTPENVVNEIVELFQEN